MKVVIGLATTVLIVGWGCGGISSLNAVNPPPVQAQNPPQFSGTFAFGNGPLIGAIDASNGNVSGAVAFAGSCLAQITGTYQEIGQTAFGQMTATPSTTCPTGSVVFNFFVAVSSTKAYFSFSVAGTNNQFPEEGFK